MSNLEVWRVYRDKQVSTYKVDTTEIKEDELEYYEGICFVDKADALKDALRETELVLNYLERVKNSLSRQLEDCQALKD